METKTSKIVKTTFKVINIVLKVARVFCIIGVVFTAFGFISCVLTLGNPELRQLILSKVVELEEGLSDFSIYCSLSNSFFMCLGAIVYLTFEIKYLDNVETIGHPFTNKLSKDLLKAGLIQIISVIVVSILASISISVIQLVMKTAETFADELNVDITVGLILVFGSFVTKLAAEMINKEEVVEEIE